MEITQSKQRTERPMKKKSSIRDLWDNIKCSNICIIGMPKGEEREKGIKNVFEKNYG